MPNRPRFTLPDALRTNALRNKNLQNELARQEQYNRRRQQEERDSREREEREEREKRQKKLDLIKLRRKNIIKMKKQRLDRSAAMLDAQFDRTVRSNMKKAICDLFNWYKESQFDGSNFPLNDNDRQLCEQWRTVLKAKDPETARIAEKIAMQWIKKLHNGQITDVSITAINRTKSSDSDNNWVQYDIIAKDSNSSSFKYDVKSSRSKDGRFYINLKSAMDIIYLGIFVDRNQYNIVGTATISDFNEALRFTRRLSNIVLTPYEENTIYDQSAATTILFKYPERNLSSLSSVITLHKLLSVKKYRIMPGDDAVIRPLFKLTGIQSDDDINSIQDEFTNIITSNQVIDIRLYHLYIFTVHNFFFRKNRIPSDLYRKAFCIDGYDTMPFGLWDPTRRYVHLLEALKHFYLIRNTIPPISEILIDQNGTIIANHHKRRDRERFSCFTLYAHCRNCTKELIYGLVEVNIEGYLVCTCNQ